MAKTAKLPKGISVYRKKKRLPDGTVKEYPPKYRARVSWTHTHVTSGLDVTEQVELGTFETLADAKAALEIARADILRGTFIPPSERRRRVKEAREEAAKIAEVEAFTAGQWVDRWLESIRSGDYAPNTKRSYVSCMNLFTEQFGSTPLRSITPEDMAAWFESLKSYTRTHKDGKTVKRSRSARTIENIRLIVSTCLTAAQEAGRIEAIPMPKVNRNTRQSKAVKERRRIDYVPTPEQIATAVDAALPQVGAAIMLMYYAGLRPAEARALQRKHLVLSGDNPRVKVVQGWSRGEGGHEELGPGKTEDAIRDVPLDGVTAEWLQDYLRRNVAPNADAWVLPSPRDRERAISEKSLNEGAGRWYQVRTVAGIPDKFRLYDLRSACLTRLAQAGATLAEAMRFGGHRDLQAALIYQRAEESRLRALVDQRPPLPSDASVVELPRAGAN